jgi:cytochrome P450
VKAEWSDFFHDGRVLTMAVSMVFAGSETTAISLAAIFYFLLDSPPCYEELVREIDNVVNNGTLENPSNGIVW